MDLLAYVEQSQLKKSVPKVKPGNIVAVHQRIKEGKKERVQVFKGIVLKVKGGYGLCASFTVRRIASGVGVEKTFLFHSPLIEKIVVMKQAKVRRSKLYYLRGRFGKRAKLDLMDVTSNEEVSVMKEILGEEVESLAVDTAKSEVEVAEVVTEKVEDKVEKKEEKAEKAEKVEEKKEEKKSKKKEKKEE